MSDLIWNQTVLRHAGIPEIIFKKKMIKISRRQKRMRNENKTQVNAQMETLCLLLYLIGRL